MAECVCHCLKCSCIALHVKFCLQSPDQLLCGQGQYLSCGFRVSSSMHSCNTALNGVFSVASIAKVIRDTIRIVSIGVNLWVSNLVEHGGNERLRQRDTGCSGQNPQKGYISKSEPLLDGCCQYWHGRVIRICCSNSFQFVLAISMAHRNRGGIGTRGHPS